MSADDVLAEAREQYYALNKQIRAYENKLPPKDDIDWIDLLDAQRRAEKLYYDLRHKYGFAPLP